MFKLFPLITIYIIISNHGYNLLKLEGKIIGNLEIMLKKYYHMNIENRVKILRKFLYLKKS